MKIVEQTLAGIEAEVRAVQLAEGASKALSWWYRNFAHKYPDYTYDIIRERAVKRRN